MGAHRIGWVSGIVMFTLVGGCAAERLAPKKVGSAVGRLTVRNVAVMTSVIAGDTACGFESPAVLNNFTLSGAIGEEGDVTYTVKDCLKNFGPLAEVKRDCNDDATRIGGAATISGTKTVHGILTGNPETPVVPLSADAATFVLSARLSDFEVKVSTSRNSLLMRSGEVAWKAEPHLAISATTGLCSIATSDLTVSEITYQNGLVHVTSEKRDFDVHVPTSSYSAQIGRWGPRENWLSGQITIRNKVVPLPNKSDDTSVLDDTYERAYHLASFACTDDLQVPISYQCKSLAPALAHGLSRMTVPTLANLTKLIDRDTVCGFSSPAVLGAVQITGQPGVDGGSATWRTAGCVLDFATPTIVSEDCNGDQRIVQGRATVTATKTFYGFPTGDPDNPLAPTSWDPALITMRVDFDEHDAQDTGSGNTLTVHSGVLTGIVRPRAAIDLATGVCSVPGGTGAFESLVWRNADITLRTASGTFRLDVTATDLDAQVGPGNTSENSLRGQATIAGETFTIPVPGEPPDLDPSYDAQAFEDAWASCLADVAVPRSDAECSLNRVIGTNTARLLTKTAGTLGSMINDDTVCGYESDPVRLGPIDSQGSVGGLGYITWAARNCPVVSGAAVLMDTDCQGVETWASGTARVWSRRTVRGELETLVGVIDSIIPRTRDATDMILEDVELSEFTVWDEKNGQKTLPVQLTIHSGNIAGIVHPILGESAATAGVYDYVTPVSRYEGISATGLSATLQVGAASFEVQVSAASIDAMNGVWAGDGNRIAGTMEINGQRIVIGPDPLVPGYDQAAFNASYTCDPLLRAPIPHL